MSDPEEKKRSFIKEHIVPRKPYKKILTMALTALLLGLLFGGMAGLSFYASQGILKDNNTEEKKSETIVIARDQEPEPSTEEILEEEEEPETGEEPAEEEPSEEQPEENEPEEAETGEEPGEPEAETGEADAPEDAGGEIPAAPGDEAAGEDEEPGQEAPEGAEEPGDEAAGDGEPDEDTAPEDAGDQAPEDQEPQEDGKEESETPDEPEDGDTEESENTKEAGPEDGEPGEGPGDEDAESHEGHDPEAPDEPADEGPEEGEPEETKPGDEENEDVYVARSLREMYDSVSAGFVTVTIKDSAGTDLFGKPVTSRRDQFGVIMFESEEFLYILTDGTGISYSSEVTMTHAGRKVPVEIQEQDSLTNLMVLRAQKTDFKKAYAVIPLGNSFLVKAADYVFMAGSPDGEPGAVDYGVVTYVNGMDEVTDGYRQLFTTNMQRSEGGSAVLFNRDCEIIGWVSDYSCGDSERVHAAGISPLKYVIEDLCSAESTAYLGVRCLTVNMDKAEETGLSTGLYVTEIDENSPAYMMGIQAGDRIVSINDKDINDSRALQNVLDELSSGKETVLLIERQGRDGDEPLRVVLFVGKR